MLHFLENLRRDLVLALRSLRRAPAFAITVVATIAIGMGAIAAVLSIIDKAYLQLLPVPEPERLVEVRSIDSRPSMRGAKHGSFRDWRDLRTGVQGVEGLAAFSMGHVKFGGDHAGLEVYSAFVSGNYFSTLGVRPARGRYFLPDEEEPQGAHPVVVVSDVLWRGAFGADEMIVGKRIVIGFGEFTIVGVAPPGFTGIQPEGRTDLWIPYTMQERATGAAFLYTERDARRAMYFGRLADDATVATVQGSLDNTARMLAAAYPITNETVSFRAVHRERMVRLSDAPQTLVMFGLALAMIALVHLIACANVASLLLARGAARRRELGVRICLGASRTRVLMQTLAEPVLLGLGGAAGAVFVARALTRAIGSMWFLSAMEPTLDIRMVVVVLLVAAVTVVKFGMVPALAAARTDPIEVVQGASGGVRGAKAGTSGFLIAGQVAISVLLLAQAALLLGKYRRETTADPGFDYRRMVVARVHRQGFYVRSDKTPLTYETAMERAAAVPGLKKVASAGSPPLLNRWFDEVTPGGTSLETGERAFPIQMVGPGYFATIGARIVEGREFSSYERRVLPPYFFDVVIVNESFARRYWPDRSAIGETVIFRKKPARIVGIVADLRDVKLSGSGPRVYFPLHQWLITEFTIVATVGAAEDTRAAAARLHGALSSLSGIHPPNVQTMAEIHDQAMQVSRIMAIALSICAAIALLLTAVGLYGAVTMWAATRRRELGIRIALGARARHVYQLLLRDAGRLAIIGGAVGALGAVALVKFERSRFGPSLAFDALPVGVVLGVFLAVVTVAALLPARRATSLQPSEVIRSD